MRVPVLLFLLSVGIVVVSIAWVDLSVVPAVEIGSLMIVASLVLLLRRPRKWIVVDGSNVMHWQGDVAELETVAVVLKALIKDGFHPVVWFDANVGYKVSDRFMSDAALARHLPVPKRQIMVSPSGTPADPLILEGAIELGARVVTRDRFRDWVDQYPRVKEAGFLLRGSVENGVVKMVEK